MEKKSWDDYVFVNQQFADAIVEQYQTGDIGESTIFDLRRFLLLSVVNNIKGRKNN
jgi:nitrogen regulatory protein PII